MVGVVFKTPSLANSFWVGVVCNMHMGLSVIWVLQRVLFGVAEILGRIFQNVRRNTQGIFYCFVGIFNGAPVFANRFCLAGASESGFASWSPINRIDKSGQEADGLHPRKEKEFAIFHNAFFLLLGRPIVGAILYYLGTRVGFLLTFQPHAMSTLWPPNAILTSMLLLTPPRQWWLIVAAALPAHVLAQLGGQIPIMMVLCWFVSNCAEALIAAGCVRRLIGYPVRFDSFRSMALFIVAGALLAPFIASFLDAGFVTALAWGFETYWQVWRMRLVSNGLAMLLIVPLMVIAGSHLLADLRKIKIKRAAEGFILGVGLLTSGTLLFEENNLPTTIVPILAYLPMPFLLWAAMRFGPAGLTTSMLVMVLLSIWAVIHGRGPFGQMTPAQNVFSVQVLNIVMSVPLMLLSAVREEQKNATRALTESETRFRLIADAAPGMLWMSGLDKGCTFLSKGWLEYTGRPLNAELGNGWVESVHPEDLPACLKTYAASFDQQEPFRMEYRLRRHDAEYGWVLDEGVPRYSDDGAFLGYVGMTLDITDRKKVDAALKQSEKRFREVVESQPDMVCRFLPDATLTLVNEAYCRFFGKRREQLIGRSMLELIPEEQHAGFLERMFSMVRNPKTLTMERKMAAADGAEKWHQWIMYPIFDGNGKVAEFQANGRDVTEWRKTEDSLRATHQQINALAYRLIHAEEEERRRIARELHDDFNQKLAAHAIGISNLMEEAGSDGVSVHEKLEKLQNEAISLSDNIRLIAHELHPARIELAGLENTLRSFCTEFSGLSRLEIELYVEVKRTLPEHIGLCCFRVVQESLRNIAKHARARKVQVRVQVLVGSVVLLVADDGVGVEEQNLKTSRGMGITSMEERIQYLSGKFHIGKRKSGGTLIAVEVPIL